MPRALRLVLPSLLALVLSSLASTASADVADGPAPSPPCEDKEEGDACSHFQYGEDFEGVCIGKSEGLACCDEEGNCEGPVAGSGCAIAPGEPGSVVALGVVVAAGALWATRRRAGARR